MALTSRGTQKPFHIPADSASLLDFFSKLLEAHHRISKNKSLLHLKQLSKTQGVFPVSRDGVSC